MSEGSQVLKVTLCVQILKWQSVSDHKGRYRAARAAKKQRDCATACASRNVFSLSKCCTFYNIGISQVKYKAIWDFSWYVWVFFGVLGSRVRRVVSQKILVNFCLSDVLALLSVKRPVSCKGG